MKLKRIIQQRHLILSFKMVEATLNLTYNLVVLSCLKWPFLNGNWCRQFLVLIGLRIISKFQFLIFIQFTRILPKASQTKEKVLTIVNDFSHKEILCRNCSQLASCYENASRVQFWIEFEFKNSTLNMEFRHQLQKLSAVIWNSSAEVT